MSTGLFIICIASIVLTIVIGLKSGINIGFVGLCFAFIIGYFFVGQTPAKVFSHLSLTLLRSFTLVCGMFYFVRQTGAIGLIGKRLLYATRKIPWAINLTFFLIAAVLAFLGADTVSILAITSALAFGMYKELNVHPLALLMSLGLGAGAFTLVPWGFNGLIVAGAIETYVDAQTAYGYIFTTSYTVCLAKFIVVIIFTFLTGSFKTKRSLNVEKPAPFNREQKQAMLITFIPVAITLVFSILNTFSESYLLERIAGFTQIYVMACFAIILGCLLKLGTAKDVIMKAMPWNIVMLSTGMYCLIGVCTDAGMAKVIATFLGENFPAWALGPMITLLGGVMSVFAGATTTVFTLLMAVGMPLCAVVPSINPQYVISCILCGSMVTAMSPFSAGGALLMGYCDVPELQENNYLFKTLIKGAFLALACTTVMSLLHIYPGS